MKTEIAAIEQMNAVELFQGKKLGPLLKAIKKEVSNEVPDVDSEKGRDRIKSLAHKVARSKTTLDALGKDLVADQKEVIKLVDETRRQARDFLDDLKATVRKPLTDWEAAEEKRIEKIQAKIQSIRSMGAELDNFSEQIPAAQLKACMEKLKSMKITKVYDEWQDEAISAKNETLVVLMELIPEQEQREADAIELEQRREAEQEEQRIAEEQHIARVAVENAEIESAAELNEIKEKEAREAAEKEAREKDVKHRRACNRDAVECLMRSGFSQDVAKRIVQVVAKGNINYMSINY